MKKILITTLLLALSACNFSEGQRYGQITKFSRKGVIFKTYEGELATMAKGAVGTMISNSFLFSVKDKAVILKIQDAMSTGKSVSLTYQQEFWAWYWEGDTKYFITEVQVKKD